MKFILILLPMLVFGCASEDNNPNSVPSTDVDVVATVGYGTVSLACGYNNTCAQTCKLTLIPHSGGSAVSYTVNAGEYVQDTLQAGTWETVVSKNIYCSGVTPILQTFSETFILLDGGDYSSTY